MRNLPRVAARIFGEPLAIDPKKLDIIVTAVGPRLRGGSLDEPDDDYDDDDEDDSDPDGVGASSGASGPTGQQTIAVIDIAGTLVSRAAGMQAWSGMTSYARIKAQIASAMEDESVCGLILSIDSPGGEVTGVFDLADAIYAYRGIKPMCAVVDCAASAAYLIASSCDSIIVSQTGIVGSIGIIALHVDQSGADEKAGMKYTAIYAGDRKNDGNPHEPLTPEAKGNIQSRVDQIYGMFAEAVGRNRQMSSVAVKGTQAGIFMGQDGIDEGLADSIGTQDDAVALIRSVLASPSESPVASATSSQKKENGSMRRIPAASAANNDELVTNARQAGYADAGLIADLCTLAGSPQLAAKFIGEKKTVEQVRTELISAKAAGQGPDIDPSVPLGLPGEGKPRGKASPWGDVLGALGIRRKDAQ